MVFPTSQQGELACLFAFKPNKMTNNLKIALIGYGKMGREIHKLAPAAGIDVTVIIDQPEEWLTYHDQLQTVDVAIEFTSPHIVTENLKKLISMHIPVVTGTTGWMHKLDEIEQFCKQSNGSLFYASNFSIGVNLFFALNRYLADLMSQYPDYTVHLDETHHTQKLDAPSGTAISMLEDVLKINPDLKGWKFISDNPDAQEISVEAHRIAGVPGIHKLTYDSEIDSISIEHIAHNRVGFAKGALMAARWLKDKKGIFTMNDLLKL
jgi:4-hydroxy-tetrahydrodipicolinate reductase